MITVTNTVPEYSAENESKEVTVQSCADDPEYVYVHISSFTMPGILAKVNANDLINAVKNATNTGY